MKVKQADILGNVVNQIRSVQRQSNDSCKISASFVQTVGLCAEGKPLYVTDAASGKVQIISSVLNVLGKLYSTFGVHRKGTNNQGAKLHIGCHKIAEVEHVIQAHVSSANESCAKSS